MNVSIIIVNYNTVSLLCDAIDSVLEKTTDISYEIIVVDNNSSDNSENIIPQKYGDKVIFIKLPENIGFGRANNEGVKLANGKYLFLLNPDTILLNNAVKILADFLENNANAGICGGNLVDEKRQAAHSYSMILPSITWELNILFAEFPEKLFFSKNVWFNHTGKARKVAHITGADLMIKADLFRRLNGFDADFFMYFEETELTFRLKKVGFEVYSIPQAEIMHLEGKSIGTDEKRVKMILSGRNLFYKKTRSQMYHAFANGIFRLTAVSRIALFTLLNNKEKCRYWTFTLKNIR